MLGAASARVGLDLLLTRNFRIVLGGVVQQHCSHAFEAFLEGDDYVYVERFGEWQVIVGILM